MVKSFCSACTEQHFKETKKKLDKMLNKESKVWLEQQLDQKSKWALAYDEGGYRYNIMNTNLVESLNNIFKGVRALSVSGIVEYSFTKCNEYFVKRWNLARERLVVPDG